MKGSSGCVEGTEKMTHREDVGAYLQNSSTWNVGVTAAEPEYCQSAVGPLELSDDE